jgi:hypothetical protein
MHCEQKNELLLIILYCHHLCVCVNENVGMLGDLDTETLALLT